MPRSCHACRAPLPAAARFCGRCGAATREHAHAVRRRFATGRRTASRAVAALAVAFAGTLFGLLGSAVGGAPDADGSTGVLLGAAAVFAAALASALVMRALRASFAGAPRWPWLLAALPAGALSALASVAFVRLLVPAHVLAAGQPAPALVLAALVLAPLGEEWLCRGAAWHACRHLAPARTTLLVTAVLFAFLHGLGGGSLLELPHRFVAGLVFGWLRWKSGSLVPPILAHAAHNALAVTVLA